MDILVTFPLAYRQLKFFIVDVDLIIKKIKSKALANINLGRMVHTKEILHGEAILKNME